MAVVRPALTLLAPSFCARRAELMLSPSCVQRFAETRLSDLICQNEAVALEFDVYGKNAITRASSLPSSPFLQPSSHPRLTLDPLRATQSTASRPTRSSRWRTRPPTSRSTAAPSASTSPP